MFRSQQRKKVGAIESAANAKDRSPKVNGRHNANGLDTARKEVSN